jgi:photosystem II stability/assembly factor-like uncharacterized protein
MRRPLAGFGCLMLLLTGCGSKTASKGGSTNSPGRYFGQVTSIVVDPRNALIVYAIDEGVPAVLKSTNGGASWRKTGLNDCINFGNNKPSRGQSVSAIAVTPNGRLLYAGTSSNPNGPGIWKSADSGKHWRLVGPSPGGDVPLLVIDPKNPRILYTWTQGVFKSTDGGTTWHKLDVGGAVDTLAIDPRNPQNVYAGAGFSGAVLKSTNGGASWRIVGLAGEDVEALAIDPKDAQPIYAGTLDGIFRSQNAGRTWRAFALQGQEVWALGIASTGRVLYAGTNDSVLRVRSGR